METERKRKRRARPHEMQAVIQRYRELHNQGIGIMEACEDISLKIGMPISTIHQMVNRLLPTTDLAEAYLKSQALRLAARVVRKANAQEAIDVLSRKNMGVLAPKTEESGGIGGFFLSVQAESCGAVRVGVSTMTAPTPQPQLSPAPQVIEAIPLPLTVKRDTADHSLQGNIKDRPPNKDHLAAIAAARRKIAKAQRREKRLKRAAQANEKV